MTPQETKILIVGSNMMWGKGDTVAEAKKAAGKPKHYIGYVCHPETTIDGMGGPVYPAGYQPKVIISKPRPVKTRKQ